MSPSCTILKWKRDKHSVTLLDNLNLFRMPLADLGAMVGVEKPVVDFDTVTDADLFHRCREDVKILVKTWQWWLAFLDEQNLGDFACTIASQAFHAYRHRFMHVKVGIHNNEQAVDLERLSYKGARCEVLRLGRLPQETYYKLDVNGLYAAMMKWNVYPSKLLKVIQRVSVDYLKTLLKTYLAIAEVVVETASPKYPISVNGHTTFPTGTFETVLTTPELQEALAHGEVKAVGKVALYIPEDLFSEYVDFFSKLREQAKIKGDFATSSLYKLLRNALQGKLGQHGYSQSIVGNAPLDVVDIRRWYNPETKEECTDWTFGGKVIRQVNTGEGDDSFPGIPSHVNAYGRMYLWQLMNLAGLDHVFYVDTDSLLVDQEGYNHLAVLIDPVKLGYLKLEGTATEVDIRAKKDYAFGGKNVIKGVRKDAQEVKPGMFAQWHFSSLRYAFEAQCLEGVTVSKVRKEMRRVLTSGTEDKDGWVIPAHLRMGYQQVLDLDPARDDKVKRTWWYDQQWLESLRPTPEPISWFQQLARWLAQAVSWLRRLRLRPVYASFARSVLAVWSSHLLAFLSPYTKA